MLKTHEIKEIITTGRPGPKGEKNMVGTYDLESKLNAFLKTIPEDKIHDIKYTVTTLPGGDVVSCALVLFFT